MVDIAANPITIHTLFQTLAFNPCCANNRDLQLACLNRSRFGSIDNSTNF